MIEFKQPFNDLRGEEVADYRNQQIDRKDEYGKDYRKLQERVRRWRRARVGLTIAPFVAAGSLMFTETGKEANNFQRFIGGFYAFIGSAGLVGASSAWTGRLQGKSERVALSAAEITNELGIDRDPWINEGVEKWRVKERQQQELKERNYI